MMGRTSKDVFLIRFYLSVQQYIMQFNWAVDKATLTFRGQTYS